MTRINTRNVQSILDRYDAENDASKTTWQDARLADLCIVLAELVEAERDQIAALAERVKILEEVVGQSIDACNEVK